MATDVDVSSFRREIKTLIIDLAKLQDMTPEDIADDRELFANGLGLDSIDMLEVIVNVEKRYGFKVQNTEEGRKALQNISTLSDAILQHRLKN